MLELVLITRDGKELGAGWLEIENTRVVRLKLEGVRLDERESLMLDSLAQELAKTQDGLGDEAEVEDYETGSVYKAQVMEAYLNYDETWESIPTPCYIAADNVGIDEDDGIDDDDIEQLVYEYREWFRTEFGLEPNEKAIVDRLCDAYDPGGADEWPPRDDDDGLPSRIHLVRWLSKREQAMESQRVELEARRQAEAQRQAQLKRQARHWEPRRGPDRGIGL